MSSHKLERILLVEDDPDIQSVTGLALRAVGGFTVEICGSGSEALERGPAFAPDLILLDVMMPGMDGLTTLSRLRALPGTADTPVIFLTARAQSGEMARYKGLGAIGVVAKPFDPMTLASQVRALWEHGDLGTDP
jgi:two-component system OmpR family response regulator